MTSGRLLACWGGIFDWDVSLKRLDGLNALAESPDLWNDPAEAQKLMRERTSLDKAVATIKALQSELDDNAERIQNEQGWDGFIAQAIFAWQSTYINSEAPLKEGFVCVYSYGM